MTQRTIAALVAVPLVLALLVAAWVQPLPFVTYEPGLTINVLGTTDGNPVISIEGAKTYPVDGQLRLTTVYVSRRESKLDLYTLMGDWFSGDDAVYPKDVIYPKGETQEQDQQQGQVEMVSSQDTATAAALTELGYDIKPAVEVVLVEDGTPAEGNLKVRDIFEKVNGKPVTSAEVLVNAITAATPGKPIDFQVLRKGKHIQVSATPKVVGGRNQIGVQLATGFVFPFQVDVGIDPNIGGPSAGTMFALGIYDTLTPGSLTGGHTIAGTGTMDDADGTVGAIGGIQQKIAGARAAGAELFLVPADNCADAIGAANGDMRLVRVPTLHSAITSIKAWVADPDADLPTCQAAS